MVRIQRLGADRGRVEWGVSALGFHSWADLYWQEFEALPSESRETSVGYQLLCRAIEIEFKAWRRETGATDGLIERFLHDLIASYRALPKKHQVLSVDEASVLQRANSFYLSLGFENAESQPYRSECPQDIDIRVLEAVARKVMEHGDRLNLK